MEIHVLQAEVRDERGKGPARRLRTRGLIPAVFYGDDQKPIMLAVSPKELSKSLSTDKGRNAVIKLNLDGGKESLSMVKELQVDPLRRDLLHVDFYRVQEGVPVVVHVPFVTKGRAAGVVAGGELHVVFHKVPVKAAPENIPTKIEVDVSHLELHDVIQVKDLALPDGVQVTLAPLRTLVAVETERKREEEAATGGTPAEGEAAATPAAAVPAAAKPAAAKK